MHVNPPRHPIHEVVITTVSPEGRPHIAPMGVRRDGARVLLAPFRPSVTLDNIEATGHAVMNLVTDGRIFAGCVTGRGNWPVVPAECIDGVRLAAALRHVELVLREADDDPVRPTVALVPVHEATHAPFEGLNRAQAAVVEGAVLVSRLHLLPREKVLSEMAYLSIAIEKTAAPPEHEAWTWLCEAVDRTHPGAGPARPEMAEPPRVPANGVRGA